MLKTALTTFGLTLVLLPALQAQSSDDGFKVLPRDVLSGSNPRPVHSTAAGHAVGRSNLQPLGCTADVYSRDASWTTVSNAKAHDWRHWAYTIVFDQEQDEVTANGSVSVGGVINLRDPECSGKAYIFHQCSIDGMQGKATMAGKLRGAEQSQTGLIDGGEVCLDLKIKVVGIKWCFNPTIKTHTNTGEIPMKADGEDESAFDTIQASATNVTSLDVLIAAEVNLHAYSNGAWPESASAIADVESKVKLAINEAAVSF